MRHSLCSSQRPQSPRESECILQDLPSIARIFRDLLAIFDRLIALCSLVAHTFVPSGGHGGHFLLLGGRNLLVLAGEPLQIVVVVREVVDGQ